MKEFFVFLLCCFVFAARHHNSHAAPSREINLFSDLHKNLHGASIGNLPPHLRNKIYQARLSPILMDEISSDFDDLDAESEYHGPNKRQFDEYGHLRFGKRGEFDEYGHLRFGRSFSPSDK